MAHTAPGGGRTASQGLWVPGRVWGCAGQHLLALFVPILWSHPLACIQRWYCYLYLHLAICTRALSGSLLCPLTPATTSVLLLHYFPHLIKNRGRCLLPGFARAAAARHNLTGAGSGGLTGHSRAKKIGSFAFGARSKVLPQ